MWGTEVSSYPSIARWLDLAPVGVDPDVLRKLRPD